MNVLITGGAGFIGAFTAKALQERGDNIVLYDDMNSFLYPAALKEARLHALFPNSSMRPRLVVGTILDAKLLATVLEEEEIDTVLHFAALANPAKSLNHPAEYTLINVLGTLNVLTAATEREVSRFMFAGSSSVYNDEETPFREGNYPLSPKSPYGASKASAEIYCRMWHELHGLPVTVLRFFSVYGPWGRPDMAPFVFTRQILHGETLEVSSERARDVTYIDDVVAGVMAAVDKQFGWEVINIGRGEPQSLDELVQALGKAAGKEISTRSREAPPGEMRVTYADTTKAKELLGWTPRVSIAEGAQHLVDWVKAYDKG